MSTPGGFNQNNLNLLYNVAFKCIQDAKFYEKSGQLIDAKKLYLQGIENFMKIIKLETNTSKKGLVKKNLEEFIEKAENIQQQITNDPFAPFAPSAPPINDNDDKNGENDLGFLDLPEPPSNNIQIDLPDPPSNEGYTGNNNDDDNNLFNKAQIFLDEALEFDQHKQYNEAITKYKISSQIFLDAIKESNNNERKSKYREKVSVIIGRIELLNKLIEQKQSESASQINQGVAGDGLTKKEIQVLRKSSYIRNLCVMPWMESDSVIYNVNNNEAELYRDPSGLLPLSAKQQNKFGKWKRIKNISSSPSIVSLVTPYSITQTLISDCSFVSSLTVTALYEKIFHKKLITSIIYPQNNKGVPIYNKNGKYVVKLFINGCYRKVEIDDYLPMSQHNKLLCSYSNNKNEFWVSLIEKAFLKVMGGYDFPGSTSSEDLHVLTSWIPERIGFNDNTDKFNIDKIFDRLVSGSKYGDCLITLSSIKMDENEADSLGLVPTHAYAVLRVEKLGNHKFMLIKNPWATLRWKGRFSADDDKNWTPQLRKALNYNPNKEKQFDNGIFWMSIQDITKYFSAVFLNWNPQLFKWRITQHGYWNKSIGPKNDSYNLSYNPQYTLDVYIEDEKVEIPSNNNPLSSINDDTDNDNGSVWILLSKHMENTKREEQDKNDFLTLHVYDENTVNTRDRRIFYRRNALHTGVYINSPHYLMKIDIDRDNKYKNKKTNTIHRKYTIVISQYEKHHDVSYTITAYSTLPSRFKPIDDSKLWKLKKIFVGKWDKMYCGGSPNHATFPQNPQFKIKNLFKTHLRFMLEAPIDYSVNIQIYLCTNDIDDDDNNNNNNNNNNGNNTSNYDDDNNNNNNNMSNYDNNADLDDNDNDNNNNPDLDDQVKGGKILRKSDYSKNLLIGDSGPYRPGVCMVDVLNVEPATYIAIISTFKPNQYGGFKFTIKSVEGLQIKMV